MIVEFRSTTCPPTSSHWGQNGTTRSPLKEASHSQCSSALSELGTNPESRTHHLQGLYHPYDLIVCAAKKARRIFLCVHMVASIQDLDDESVLETVDFSEFESLFQVKRFKKNAKLAKREDS